ncbi:MAG: universal stress protein [Rubrivivax sp.]|nr:universal stress protein [Rubrivivax sp.]
MTHPFTRLLLATEHSVYDGGAETLALALARRCGLPLAAVLPVLSNPEFEMIAPQLAARADAEAAVKRQSLEATARAQQVVLEVAVRRGPEPFESIVAAARERDADLIVIRRRGQRGLLANLLVGEMVSKVVAHAPCSVLVAPRGARLWQRQVMVGVDPQESPDAACLARAAAIAADHALPLRLVCVADGAGAQPQAEQALAAALAHVRALHDRVDGEVCRGRAHQALIDAARARDADLLVVARHGASSLARAWIGGTAQKVIGLAECPVLVHVNPPPSPAA